MSKGVFKLERAEAEEQKQHISRLLLVDKNLSKSQKEEGQDDADLFPRKLTWECPITQTHEFSLKWKTCITDRRVIKARTLTCG